MVLYTLYFIFYSVYIHFSLSLSLFLRLLRPFHLLRYTTPLCSSLAFSPRCMTTTTTTRLHAERARRLFLRQILCRWRTRSGSDLASFDSDTLALHSTLFLHFSLPLTHSFSLSHPPFSCTPPRRRRNIFPEHYFYRPPFVRAPAPRYYPLINCREKIEKKK